MDEQGIWRKLEGVAEMIVMTIDDIIFLTFNALIIIIAIICGIMKWVKQNGKKR